MLYSSRDPKEYLHEVIRELRSAPKMKLENGEEVVILPIDFVSNTILELMHLRNNIKM